MQFVQRDSPSLRLCRLFVEQRGPDMQSPLELVRKASLVIRRPRRLTRGLSYSFTGPKRALSLTFGALLGPVLARLGSANRGVVVHELNPNRAPGSRSRPTPAPGES